MKKIEVTIMGNSYVLACPAEGEAMLQSAVTRVDKEMCAIRDSGKIKARERIAVLASLNLAYALAQRGAATALPSSSENAASGNVASSMSSDEDAQLGSLIDKIDQALGPDGRLL